MDLKTTIMGGWFNSVVRLRLSQPQARDWAWAWAELGKKKEIELTEILSLIDIQISHLGPRYA